MPSPTTTNCDNLNWVKFNYTPLHYSVRNNNVKLTESLLKNPSTDVNARSLDGETPLFLSLRHKVNKEIIVSLIESKCDVQIPNSRGIAPLSLAVKRRSPEIAQFLIRNGADVDAKDSKGYTALHEAVKALRYRAVCMLLYYNASVNEQDSIEGLTPFMLSMKRGKRIAKVLYNYVTDFNTVDYTGHSLIYIATNLDNPLRNNILFQCGGSINFCEDISTCLCMLIEQEVELNEEEDKLKKAKNSEFFRHVILNVDHANLLETSDLISTLVSNPCFTPAEFVEYLFILLSTEHAVDAVKKGSCILYDLYPNSYEVVSIDDWLGFAYLVFSMGKPLHYFDFYVLYTFFGFGREFEAILRMKPPIQWHHLDEDVCGIMPFIIFHSCIRTESIIDEILKEMSASYLPYFTKSLLDYLRYYTMSNRLRQELNCICDELSSDCQIDSKFVEVLNERRIASLLELCRNKIRKVIVRNNSDKKGIYKTFDDINCLPVPEFLKDILHLKRPLYL